MKTNPETKMTTIRIQYSTYDKLRDMAYFKRLSLNTFISNCLDEYVETELNKEPDLNEKPFTNAEIVEVIKHLIKTNNWDKHAFQLDNRFSVTQIELIQRECLPHMVTKSTIQDVVSKVGVLLWK